MRKVLCALLCAGLLCAVFSGAPASAQTPTLTDVFPDIDQLAVDHRDILTVTYTASEAGTLSVTAKQGGAEAVALSKQTIQAGPGSFAWDGKAKNKPITDGTWSVQLQLTNEAGEQSAIEGVVVTVFAAKPTPVPTEKPIRTPSPERQSSQYSDPHTDCFWSLDLDNLDIYDAKDQQKIWHILTQPVTVLDIHPTEHVYPLDSPTADPKDSAHFTGQLHGQSQAVHVLKDLGNGWTEIEAYTNDGYKAPRNSLRTLVGNLIHGYVKTELLKVVTPDQHIGVVIDKLTQRLYVFEDGKLTGETAVSTGKPTKSQPYTETPAGEFLCDSWVGMFINGNMFCDLAIRINGGVLLHEVPHKQGENEYRDYSAFEQYLGQKASHGCIRVQRKANDKEINMKWLWDHLKRDAKVLVLDDRGRSLPPPDPNTQLFYNPEGGKNYHALARCPGVKERFLPLSPFLYGELLMAPYDTLTPCPVCDPPSRYEGEEGIYFAEEVPDDIIGGENDASEIDQEVDPDTYAVEEQPEG